MKLQNLLANGLVHKFACGWVAALVVAAARRTAAVAVFARLNDSIATFPLGDDGDVLVGCQAGCIDASSPNRGTDVSDRAPENKKKSIQHSPGARGGAGSVRTEILDRIACGRIHDEAAAGITGSGAEGTAHGGGGRVADTGGGRAVVDGTKGVANLVSDHLPLGRRPGHHVDAADKGTVVRVGGGFAPAELAQPCQADRRAGFAGGQEGPQGQAVVGALAPPLGKQIQASFDGGAPAAVHVPFGCGGRGCGAVSLADDELRKTQCDVEGSFV